MASSDHIQIVDRATNDIWPRTHGPAEGRDGRREIFMASRVIHQFEPGETEAILSNEQARFVFRQNQRSYIHTTDGRFMCRYGIKDIPQDLVEYLGAEAGDCSPIERDLTIGEGWDTGAVARPPMKTYGPGDIVQTAAGPVRLPGGVTDISNQGHAGGHVTVGSSR